MDGRSGSAGDQDALSLDEVLELLSHHQRRRLLQFLRGRPSQRASGEAVVDCLGDRSDERRDERPLSRDEITLRHLHVPKLSSAGLVSYDEAANEYQYHPDDRVEKWLDVIETERDTG